MTSAENNAIKVLLVDDHKVVLDGLMMLIESMDGIEVCATAVNGKLALSYLKENPVDIILLDLNMPVLNGLELIDILKKESIPAKVIVLSMVDDAFIVKRMMKKGAMGFILKNSSHDDVENAIRQVNSGQRVFSEVLESVLVGDSKERPKIQTVIPKLSKREQEILELIIDEQTTSEIAENLFISFGTVETHRRNLLNKLGARNTAGLVKAAFEYGLLE